MERKTFNSRHSVDRVPLTAVKVIKSGKSNLKKKVVVAKNYAIGKARKEDIIRKLSTPSSSSATLTAITLEWIQEEGKVLGKHRQGLQTQTRLQPKE